MQCVCAIRRREIGARSSGGTDQPRRPAAQSEAGTGFSYDADSVLPTTGFRMPRNLCFMNSTPRIPATQTGMTLIELIITVAIVAILVGISVPSFAHLGSAQKMTTTTHLVMSSFNQARMRAISTGRQVVVCPSTDGTSCRADSSWNAGWIIYDDVNRNRKLDPTETVAARVESLPAGLVATTSKARPQLMFKPDGGAWGNPLTLTVCDASNPDGEGRAIIVNNGGRARTAPAAAGACPA
jgi:type IV fimbrial biogenesis protein FimT